MNIITCRISFRPHRHWPGVDSNAGKTMRDGNAGSPRKKAGAVACYGRPANAGYYAGNRPMARYCSGDGFSQQMRPVRVLPPSLLAGVTFARYPMNGNAGRGFSLAECLIALLILSLSVLLLSQYHRQLVSSYQRQWAQRDAVRAAAQVLAGKPPAGWRSDVSRQPAADGCVRVIAHTEGPFRRQATLQQLFCPPFGDRLP